MEFFAGVLALLVIVCLVLAVGSLLFPNLAIFKKNKSRSRGFLGWASLAAVLFVAFVLVAPSSKEQPAAPHQQAITSDEQKSVKIRNASSKITEVQVTPQADGGKVWSVFIKHGVIVSNVIYETGMTLQKISKNLVNDGLVQPTDEFLYFVHVPTTDQYGRSGEGLAMKIAWQGKDLLKIDWNNMMSNMFLNLASRVELRPIVRADVAKLAQDPKEATEYRGFLVKALAK